jgi:anti-anti-sigma regulatory factor
VDDVVVLSVLPDRTPEHSDIERLAESLVRCGGVLRVVADLSDVGISSAFVARLVALNKRVVAANGKLVLYGLSPFLRDAFVDSRLDKVFDIREDLEAALTSFVPVTTSVPSISTRRSVQ